jgi:nucleotide-binding universal stress UspA family protein
MNLLVAVDLSDVTPRVIEAARAQAKDRLASIRLLHVIEPEPDFVGYEAGPDVVRDQVAHERRDERRRLEQLAQQLRAAGLDVTPRIVQAPVVEAILAEASDHDADLIILGTHGRGTVYQMLVGSTSEGVLRRSTRPILLVPAAKA